MVPEEWGYQIPMILALQYCSLLLMGLLARMAWPGVYSVPVAETGSPVLLRLEHTLAVGMDRSNHVV